MAVEWVDKLTSSGLSCALGARFDQMRGKREAFLTKLNL